MLAVLQMAAGAAGNLGIATIYFQLGNLDRFLSSSVFLSLILVFVVVVLRFIRPFIRPLLFAVVFAFVSDVVVAVVVARLRDSFPH